MRNPRPVTPQTILVAELKDLYKTMKAAGGRDEWLQSLERCLSLSAPMEEYLLKSSTAASDNLDRLEKATRKMDWDKAFNEGLTDLQLEQEMVSGELEGQFLRLLVAIAKPQQILEIGSFTGYASLAMAEALPEDGRLIACEYDAYTANFAAKHAAKSSVGHKIDIRIGPASQTIKQLADEGQIFQFVFIDADKEGYLSYFQNLLNLNLVPVGGLICVDNTLYQGQVLAAARANANGRALIKFNEAVNREQRVEQVLLPLRDGITLIRRTS